MRARREPEAFGCFYDRCHPSILRYFVAQTGSHHLAVELTAETFAQALASLRTYDPERGSGRAWLVGIAQHQFHRYLRRGEVEPGTVAGCASSAPPPPSTRSSASSTWPTPS